MEERKLIHCSSVRSEKGCLDGLCMHEDSVGEGMGGRKGWGKRDVLCCNHTHHEPPPPSKVNSVDGAIILMYRRAARHQQSSREGRLFPFPPIPMMVMVCIWSEMNYILLLWDAQTSVVVVGWSGKNDRTTSPSRSFIVQVRDKSAVKQNK